jgi:hypothetical protein
MGVGVQAESAPVSTKKTKFFSVSPSQVEAFRRCPRVWYNQTILKDREPEKPFQARGTNIHKALEIYLAKGEVLPMVGETQTLEYVQVAIPHIPKPRPDAFWTQFPKDEKGAPTAMLLLEEDGSLGPEFTWEGGPSITQYIDSVFALPDTCKIQDYKTTSDFRYAKTPEELQKNTQLCWNAKYIFTISDYDRIELEHLYLLTKGRPKAKPVSTFVTRAQVEEVWRRDMALVKEMISWAELGPPSADPLPPNTQSCDDYGGCFYRTKCGFDVATVGWKKRTEPMSEVQKSGYLAELISEALRTDPNSTTARETQAAVKSGSAEDLMAVLGGRPTSATMAYTASAAPAAPAALFAPTPAAARAPSAANNLREAMAAKRSEAPVPSGIAPPDAPSDTSTPEEVEAANAPKEEAKGEDEAETAAPAAGAEPTPKKRGRPRKDAAAPPAPAPNGKTEEFNHRTLSEDATAAVAEGAATAADKAVAADLFQKALAQPSWTPTETNEGVVPSPAPPASVADNVEALRKLITTPDPAFECGLKVLFIDTVPAKGWDKDPPVDLATMMHFFEKIAAQSAKKSDYRLISYESKGYLANAIRVLMKSLPTSVFMDSRIPGADVFLSVVTPYCSMIFRGVR